MAVLFSGADPLWQFGKGLSKEHFCEIVLKSAYWLISLGGDVVLRVFLFLALAAIMLSRAEPF